MLLFIGFTLKGYFYHNSTIHYWCYIGHGMCYPVLSVGLCIKGSFASTNYISVGLHKPLAHSAHMEGNVIFNDTLNTFMVIWHLSIGKEPLRLREEICCCHYMAYTFRLAARDLLYAQSNRQDNTNHGLCYTMEHWLEQEIAEWSTMRNPFNDQSYHEQTLYHRRKEGNVLFNDTLNTFYLQLYCVGPHG